MLALAWETFYMGTFVFVASYLLHNIAYKNNNIEAVHNAHDDSDFDDQDSESSTDAKPTNLFIRKWLDFGGGYYGIVAFVKLLLIELQQLKDFAIQWQKDGELPLDIGPHLIAEFFVQQIQAFVQAIIWPTHYLSNYSIFECAIFVGVTYMAYSWSAKLAKDKALDH